MAVYRSIRQYRRSIQKRTQKLIKSANDNAAKATFFLAGRLRSTAPRRSGQLIQSIRRRKTKNGYSVLAGYNDTDGFNVGRWVNQEFSVTPQVPGGRASRFLNTPPGASVMYGQPTGSNWTATEYPWFDGNVKKMIKRYRAGYKKVRAALRG